MINERIGLLRKEMSKNNIDYYIIKDSDYHNSEYVDSHFKERSFISGFTGSAGIIVVSKDEACLFADGRYHIQAEKQIENTEIKLYKIGLEGVINHLEYLKENIKDGETIGFDGRCFGLIEFKNMKSQFEDKNVNFKIDLDLIGDIWENRPSAKVGRAFIHDLKYCGVLREDKIQKVRCKMNELLADYYVISSLDDIAWLLNIRGNDIPNNPVVVSFLFLSEDEVVFFVDERRIPKEVREDLEKSGIKIEAYDNIYEKIKSIDKGFILFDEAKTNCKMVDLIDEKVEKIIKRNIVTDMKAIKNKVEIENLKKAQIKDCVALVKFFNYIDSHIGKETITELDVADLLEKFRKEDDEFVEPSFDTIAGYKENGAIGHYKATEESFSTLSDEGFLLIDSGGQYYSGTTDITRTISLGKISDEMKRDFTYALKAMINLTKTKFLKGTNGIPFDMMARSILWNYGIDYKHGTGHGLGFFLNVHEGPQGFSLKSNPTVYFEPGMLTTNEPGIYKEGKYGIRHENDMLTVEIGKNEYGDTFMEFETVTFCPFDIKAIDKEYLTLDEINWINEYHKKTFELLSPFLDDSSIEWLKKATAKI